MNEIQGPLKYPEKIERRVATIQKKLAELYEILVKYEDIEIGSPGFEESLANSIGVVGYSIQEMFYYKD